jgi:glycosyltransferase involved in cell wall biosynthesis
LYCGIDLDPFRTGVDRESVRSEFGIGPGHFVIGHVGRFETPKNHRFLLRVHSEVLKHEPNARLFLVGEGSLQTEIRRLADELGIIDTITFAGGRADVPRLLLGVMDAFIFPSVYEGLGLAAVEAQAAGLPSILSTAVPSAADIGSGLAKFIPLTEPPEVWARILLEARTVSRSIHSLERLQGSPFDIRNSAKTLCSLYEQT